jgi:hypothetical protein
VQRILPNSTNRESLVSANQTVRIPDWMTPTPGFILDAGAPGDEAAACFATSDDVFAMLPAQMQVNGLQLIEGFSGMDSIQNAFEEAAVGTELATQRMQWKSLPRSNR